MAHGVSIDLIVDPKNAISGIGQVEGRAAGLGDSLGRMGKVAAAALAGVAIAGTAAAAGLIASSVKAAAESQKVAAQTEAVLTSTGGAALRSAADISKLSTQLSRMSGIDDEAIQSGENLLLTFTNIKGINFDKATKSALDMSVAMGTDLQTSVLQLGKALNDPIAGVTKLQKVGVTFTQTQKDQIANYVKLGDTAKAQQIIIDEVNREFGGSAEAFGNTFAGSVDKIKTSFENVKEELGNAFLPAFSGVATSISGIFNAITDNPAIQAGLDRLSQKVSNALKPISGLLTDVANSKDPFKTLTDGLAKASPVFAAISGLIVGIQPVLPGLQNAFEQVGSSLKTAFADNGQQIASSISDMLVQVAPLVPQIVALIPPLLQLTVDLLPLLIPLVSALAQQLSGTFTAVHSLFAVFEDGAPIGDFVANVQAIQGPIASVSNAITGLVVGINVAFGHLVAGIYNTGSQIGTFFGGLAGRIGGAFAGAEKWLVNAGRSIVQGLIDGIASMIDKAVKATRGLMDAISKFFPHSPAEEGPFSGRGWTLFSGQALGLGLASGIDMSTVAVRSSINGLMGSLSAQLAGQGLTVGVNARGVLQSNYAPGAATGTGAAPMTVNQYINVTTDMDPRLAGRQLAREFNRAIAG